MAVITYVKHSFREPGAISPDQYFQFKRQLSAKPGVPLHVGTHTSFTGHFRKKMTWFIIGLATCLLLLLIFNLWFEGIPTQFDWHRAVIMVPAMIAGMIAVFTLAAILLEGPSFATAAKQREQYFTDIQQAIKNSTDYQAFSDAFYPYVPGRHKSARPNAPQTADSLLTNIFHWIDQHYWKIFLLAVVIFLVKKYLI
jgi:hypothetical protein